MVHFTFHKQQHTTSCDVTVLCVHCCVTAISKINCISDFFAINFLIAIKKLITINVFALIAALTVINLQS